jgi:hypothetical protein
MNVLLKTSLTTLAVGLASSFSANAQEIPISELSFSDPALQECVEQSAARYQTPTVEQFVYLVCQEQVVTDLAGAEVFTGLQYVYLYGDGESGVSNFDALNASPTIQNIHLRDYNISMDSLSAWELPGLSQINRVMLENLPNLDDGVWDWLSRASSINSLVIDSLQGAGTPTSAQLQNVTRLSLYNSPHIDPNILMDTLSENTNLTDLQYSPNAVSNIFEPLEQNVVYDTGNWTLPPNLVGLSLYHGRVDSMSNYVDLIERSSNDFTTLALGFNADDWTPMSRLPAATPNLESLTVWLSNLDDFELLTGWNKLGYVDVEKTKALNAEHLVTVLEENPNLWTLWMSRDSTALYCDDLDAIKAADVNGVFSGHEYLEGVEACRTDQYQFRLKGRTDDATVTFALQNEWENNIGVALTDNPNEIELTVAPIYDDSWDEQQVYAQFDSGSYAYYYLRYDQPQTEPVRIADIDFADPELAACVERMAENIASRADDGEHPEYAHELTDLLCDDINLVTDLSGLEHFTNIRYIQMFGQGEVIEDVTPLLALKKLQWITMSNKGLTDEVMAPLANYRSVANFWDVLNFQNNQLSDPDLFNGWFNYEIPSNFYLADNNYTTSPTIIFEHDFNGTLYLSGNPITDVTNELERLSTTSVGQLALGELGLDRVEQVILPETLWSVSLDANNLNSLANIVFPEAISYVTVSDNPIADLSELYDLQNLTNIRAGNTDVVSFEALTEMPQLTGLWLNDNDITDISALTSIERENPVTLDFSLTPLTDYSPALDLPWLELQSYGNGHVACAEFDALEESSTSIYYDVCVLPDGTLRLNDDGAQVSIADSSRRYGRIVQTENGFNFIPHPGQEGWIEFEIVITLEDGYSYTRTVRVYVEPGTNPARDTGIPIVILVSGDDSE